SQANQLVDPASLLRGDPDLPDRLFGRVVEIPVSMRHVEVTTDDHRPALFAERPDVQEKRIVKFQLVVEVSHRLDPKRERDIEQHKPAVIGNKNPPLIVEDRVAKTVAYRKRLVSGKEPDPGGAPRRHRRKIRMVPIQVPHLLRELFLRGFCFLDADDLRVVPEYRQEMFPVIASPEAVDVPGKECQHTSPLFFSGTGNTGRLRK